MPPTPCPARPETIAVDRNGAGTAATLGDDGDHEAAIAPRRAKHMDDIVGQDRRAIDRIAPAAERLRDDLLRVTAVAAIGTRRS